jgi:hypothetical protein
MNPIHNPFAPGAGTQPPELAGRDAFRSQMKVALERVRLGLPAKSVLMIGLRGVGKTVLLDRLRLDAEDSGMLTVRIEAQEKRSFPALLAPQLRVCLLKISRNEHARDLGQRALRALAGFVKSLKLKYQDIEVGLDFEPEQGLADNGDLEQDLQTLLETVGAAAQSAGTAVILFIDELQYVKEDELAALIAGLHRVAQRRYPITLVGAGLPQLRGRMGAAKSYAERLFDFPEIGPLNASAAADAISKPMQAKEVSISPQALSLIVEQTHGYPYFLQEWGKHVWEVAGESPVTLADVQRASDLAVSALDASFFGVRYDRVTPSERKYLRAMADLGPGLHRSGEIADRLGRTVQSLGPSRNNLIKKGIIWSPSHGDTGFTVPLFDDYMRRIMPGDAWLND